MFSIITSGIRSTMYKYNSKDAAVKFYERNCKFQKVVHKERNGTMVLEAYALTNMAYLRVLYDVVNDYEESFENPIMIAESTIMSFGTNNIFTKDLKFIIKFLSEYEFTEYISMLFATFSHFCKHPNSFLQKICGLYRLKYNSVYYYITVIFNVFPLRLNKNRIKLYDLTGSGTLVDKNEGAQPSNTVNHTFEKDWPGGITIPFSNTYDLIMQDLRFDIDLLKSLDITDYSIFISVIKYPRSIENTNICDPQENKLMTYVNSSIGSIYKGQSHYRNAIIATKNNDNLIMFIGIIDVPLTLTQSALLEDFSEHVNVFVNLENYEKHLMQFIAEYVLLNKWFKFYFSFFFLF